MSTDVGTTPRKPLTPTQRLKLFEAHKGICALCGLRIAPGVAWCDEHLRALGLGGSNDTSNRAPVHVACADGKTQQQDMPRIVKAKRQKMAALGIKRDAAQKIKSAGFPQVEKPRRGVDKSAIEPLPRRSIYE
jgi:5-methylcytosine-specific restriction enzyme A